MVRQEVEQLTSLGAKNPQQLQLAKPLDLEAAFLHTTCLAASIHCPVDWVLLREATRTLMVAVQLIRDQGLKHRMEPPESFLSRINSSGSEPLVNDQRCVRMIRTDFSFYSTSITHKLLRTIPQQPTLVRHIW